MARLERRREAGRWHVTISGLLRAQDLRRLERACGPALVEYPTPLDLEVDRLSGLDEPSRLFVRSLLLRGASLIGDDAALWADAITAPRKLED